MKSGHNFEHNGFTLKAVVYTIQAVFICLYCVYQWCHLPLHERSRLASGASHQKQIALAFLQYSEDYDGRFPPACGYTEADDPRTLQPIKGDRTVYQTWGPDRVLPNGTIVRGLLSPYAKSNELYRSPDETSHVGQEPALCYMYNDLIAKHARQELSDVSVTVVTTDAEDRPANAGHAYTLNSGPFAARFNSSGTCDAGQGASVRQARFRVEGGASFGFADGHVKWFQGGPDDPIFFPPRESACPSAVDPKTKQQLGPIPGGDMKYDGKLYLGTFHLN